MLADGGTARIRPVRPEDREALAGLHERLSKRSRYLRYFTRRPRLPELELDRATRVDYAEHMGFVAFDGDTLIGYACYHARPVGGAAEVAFQIQDGQQGRGLGTLFLEHLAAYAREHGFHRLAATVLPENRKMLEVFRDAGYPKTSHFDSGVIEVSLDIDPTQHAREVILERHRRALAEHRRKSPQGAR